MTDVKVRKAFLLDVFFKQCGQQSCVELLVKGKVRTKLLYPFDPYFYVQVGDARVKDKVERVTVTHGNDVVKVKRVEVVEKRLGLDKGLFLKVYVHHPSHVPILAKVMPFPVFEYKIPYLHRFLIDHDIGPVIKYVRKGRYIKRFLPCQCAAPNLTTMAFDIEVYNPFGKPREAEDPVIIIADAHDDEQHVFSWKESGLEQQHFCLNEKATLEQFFEHVRAVSPDVMVGYNSAMFDVPYLMARAQALGVKHVFEGNKVRKAEFSAFRCRNFLHLDLYPLMRFFGVLGMFNIRTFSLKHIFREVMKAEPVEVPHHEIWRMWDEGKVKTLVQYCLSDAHITLQLLKHYWSLLLELFSLTGVPLFDLNYATSGHLVEFLLMKHSVKQGMIIPPKPSADVVAQRRANPVEGAFVKLPQPGIYENIVVFDFRSLYPSIIISYNIDPYTVCEDCEDAYVSPVGVKFRKDVKGLIPSTLHKLISLRTQLKKALKRMEPSSPHYDLVKARVQALKIVANSFYGYLAYANSRWYSRECAASVTAWGRFHVKRAISYAQSKGFTVLYADTDSLFVLLGDKSRDEALQLLKEINESLPGVMELELEGFYKRGIFVSKKGDGAGAKKKYALLREDGAIKIRGFELVRRDWSNIARQTQQEVLKIVLTEGSKEKAVNYVRSVIERLRNKQVELSDLVIYTQLKKNPENYDVKSPEVVAALKAKQRGLPIKKGMIVPFIITPHGSNVSEKAEYAEFAKDYDANYYIEHQVLPAVLKILSGLGVSEEELKFGGRQERLTSFFE